MAQVSLYFYAFKFFTTWMVIMALLHNLLFDKVNLLLLAWITCIVGLYLSFINPRKFVFYFEGKRYVYTGLQKFIIVDSIAHVIVLYAMYYLYRNYYKSIGYLNTPTIAAIAILMVYLLITNIRKVYGISAHEVVAMAVIAGILYVLII